MTRDGTRGRASLTAAILVMLAMLGGAGLPRAWAADFDHQPLTIHADGETHRLSVEVARTASQRRQGLMDRDALADEAGMLFVYEKLQPPSGRFWMYRTRIPLDIAFIDAQGRIAAIHRLVPCGATDPQQCPTTRAGVSYRAALEVNAGYFAERGITRGACVDWPGRQGGCRAERR